MKIKREEYEKLLSELRESNQRAAVAEQKVAAAEQAISEAGECMANICKKIIRLVVKADRRPQIKDVKVSGPCTLIYWADGTWTKSLCKPEDEYDPYTGFTVAYLKKVCDYGAFSKAAKKYVPEKESKPLLEEKKKPGRPKKKAEEQ